MRRLADIARAPATNFLLAQAGWFACVLGAARDLAGLGASVALAIIALHLLLSVDPRREGRLLALATVIGLSFDSTLVSAGVLEYRSGMLVDGIAPYWIVVMWPLFATTLNSSLRWLHGRWWLAAAFGAVFAPIAYVAGARLGAVEILAMTAAMAILALGWAVLLPLLVRVAALNDGMRQARTVTGADVARIARHV
ncbi:MAG: DUF2878 domain-containing protein [Gammaproteobacteria bacterium]